MTQVVPLIASREITSRLQQRGYRIGLAIGLVVAIAAVSLPALFKSSPGPKTYDVGIATAAPGLESALGAARVRVHRTSPPVAEQKVRDGAWDAALLPGPRIVAQHAGDAVVGVVQSAYRTVTTIERLHRAGLPSRQAVQALEVTPLRVQATASKAKDERSAIALLAVIVLFSQLITFCTWVAMGVVEEKSSRVVELVLAAVRPRQLLTGKLLGIGVLAAAQVLLIGGAALIAASAAGTLTVPGPALATLGVGFIGFLLGYAFFAALAAALGATVSRQEEVSGVLTPVTLTLTVCYAAGFAAVGNPHSTLARLASIVPPFSVISMPARVAGGSVPVLDVMLAVALLVVTAAGIVAVAGRIYRASILHSGTRVPLRRAWRGEAVGGAS